MSERQWPSYLAPILQAGGQRYRIDHSLCHPITQPGATKMLDCARNITLSGRQTNRPKAGCMVCGGVLARRKIASNSQARRIWRHDPAAEDSGGAGPGRAFLIPCAPVKLWPKSHTRVTISHFGAKNAELCGVCLL